MQGGESSGKAPGYFRLPSPECFMYHLHSHPSGRIEHKANRVSREAGKQESRQTSGQRIVSATRSQYSKGCHDVIAHYEHCVNVDRTETRFQIG